LQHSNEFKKKGKGPGKPKKKRENPLENGLADGESGHSPRNTKRKPVRYFPYKDTVVKTFGK